MLYNSINKSVHICGLTLIILLVVMLFPDDGVGWTGRLSIWWFWPSVVQSISKRSTFPMFEPGFSVANCKQRIIDDETRYYTTQSLCLYSFRESNFHRNHIQKLNCATQTVGGVRVYIYSKWNFALERTRFGVLYIWMCRAGRRAVTELFCGWGDVNDAGSAIPFVRYSVHLTQ